MTVSRRQLLGVLAIGLAPAMRADGAAAPAKIHRVGHLASTSKVASFELVESFKQGMRSLGFIEGQNWSFEERHADGTIEHLPALARELIGRSPDVLLVSGTPGNVAAKAATSKIPIVMVLVSDPVGTGIVASLAKPGGNITGITNIVAELAGKRLELIKELVPNAKRVAVIVDPHNPNAGPQMRSAEAAAKQLAVELNPVHAIRNWTDVEQFFKAAVGAGAHAAIRMIDPFALILRRETVALAAKYRLPLIYPTPQDAEAGGLIAYDTDIASQYRQAATFVSKILRGAKPADLPVEQPTTFELVVNLKAAKALGLKVPQYILVRATRLIE